MMAAITGRNMS